MPTNYTTQNDAYNRVLDAFRGAGCIVQEHGQDRASLQAPGHSVKDRSVSLARLPKMCLMHSFADDKEQVLAKVGLTMRDLYDDQAGVDYVYPDGRVVHRDPAKKFRQSGNTQDRSLFRVDELADAEAIWIGEGEQDVLALEAMGAVATCNAMGANKWHLFDLAPLYGKQIMMVADQDEAGKKHARQLVELLGDKARVTILRPKVGKDPADHYVNGYGLDDFEPFDLSKWLPDDGDQADDGGYALDVVCLADVQPERVSWLWPGRIPAGKLVTLDGDPSLGKSTLALTFASVITNGGAWPDGSRCEHQGDVVLLSAEDGLADTVRPRLDAAGADVSRVHAVQGIAEPDGTLRPPTLADVAALRHVIAQTGARLLIVDVLMAYLPSGTDAHKDQHIRRVLSRLSALADETDCTVLLLRHLNKAKGGDPMYRGGGSIGIVGAARAGMLVAADPEDESVRVLASVKSNLGAAPGALAYRLTDAAEHGCARVEWIGESRHDARSLLDTEPDSGDRGATDEAGAWLEDYLTEQGEARSKDAKDAARKVGISEATLKRAAQRLGVAVVPRGFPRQTYWSLLASGLNGPAVGPVALPVEPTEPTEPTGPDQAKQNGPIEPTVQSAQLAQGLSDGPDCDPAAGRAPVIGRWRVSGDPVIGREVEQQLVEELRQGLDEDAAVTLFE